MTIYLRTSVTTTPDLGGHDFYLPDGFDFDVDQYAEVFDLNRDEFDEAGVRAAVERAAGLAPGEWLKVEFMREG